MRKTVTSDILVLCHSVILIIQLKILFALNCPKILCPQLYLVKNDWKGALENKICPF